MKKNVFMRAALLLLVLTLITSCFVGGTFAKYITSDTKDIGDARVAAWGVTITANAEEAFAATYETDDHTFVDGEGNPLDGDGVSVKSSVKVVAPGTDGTLATFTITGTPEVDTSVTVDADLTLDNWMVDITDDGEDNAVYYCPIVITVGSTPISGLSFASMTEFEAAVEAAVEAYAAYYDAGTSVAASSVAISWAWAFNGEDAKDTALGDAATKATIDFTATIIATQVN